MKQIFVANPKGGSGKTTLATQVASYCAGTGLRVALADHDPQQSALDWLKARPKTCAPIIPVAAYRAQSVTDDEVDIIVHDMPAGCTIEQLAAEVRGSNKLLIPLLPSPTDIKAGVRFLMALNREGWVQNDEVDIGLVANRVRTNTKYFKVLVSFLESVNMPLLTSIRDTQNYIRAMDGGISIFDLPKSLVKKDLEHWEALINWLDL